MHTLWGSRPNYNPQCVQSSTPGFDHLADAADAWASNIKKTTDAASTGSDSDTEEHLPPTPVRHPDSQIIPSSTIKHPKRPSSSQDAREKGRMTRTKLNSNSILSEVDQLTDSFAASSERFTAASIRRAELRNDYRTRKMEMREERKKNRFHAALELYNVLYTQWDSEGRTGPRPTPPLY